MSWSLLFRLAQERKGERAWLPDGYSQIFRSYVFGPSASGLWLCYAMRQNMPSGNLEKEIDAHKDVVVMLCMHASMFHSAFLVLARMFWIRSRAYYCTCRYTLMQRARDSSA